MQSVPAECLGGLSIWYKTLGRALACDTVAVSDPLQPPVSVLPTVPSHSGATLSFSLVQLLADKPAPALSKAGPGRAKRSSCPPRACTFALPEAAPWSQVLSALLLRTLFHSQMSTQRSSPSGTVPAHLNPFRKDLVPLNAGDHISAQFMKCPS